MTFYPQISQMTPIEVLVLGGTKAGRETAAEGFRIGEIGGICGYAFF